MQLENRVHESLQSDLAAYAVLLRTEYGLHPRQLLPIDNAALLRYRTIDVFLLSLLKFTDKVLQPV